MGFDLPLVLVLFVIAVPLFLTIRHSERISKDILGRIGGEPSGRRRSAVRLALALIFVGSLIIAAAGPYVEPRTTGDVLFLSDTSRSMEARNTCSEPTFLDRSKEVMRNVLNGVPEGRFAIVAFDKLAFPVTQLTFDHSYLEEALSRGLFVGMSYRATGTELGNALSVVARKKQSLPDLYGNVRYVILTSDGFLNSLEWYEELEGPLNDLRQADIKVLAVAIGNPEPTPIPMINQNHECRGEFIRVDRQTMRIPLGRDVLMRVASGTYGEYFEEGQIEELVKFIKEKALTAVPANAGFVKQQRTSIGWFFLIPATFALFGFYYL